MKFRSATLAAAAIIFVPLYSQSVKQQTEIEANINRFNVAKVESAAAGYQYWFVDKKFLDGRTVKLSVVGPGKATHAPHHHPEDEIFFVLEGTAEFYLNGSRTNVSPLTSLYCPPNSEHGIRNAGTDTLKYLVIKKYEQ